MPPPAGILDRGFGPELYGSPLDEAYRYYANRDPLVTAEPPPIQPQGTYKCFWSRRLNSGTTCPLTSVSVCVIVYKQLQK